MKLFKVDGAVLFQTATAEYKVENLSWDALVNQENLYDFLAAYAITHEPIASTIDGKQLEAPIGSQEIWAAGVTYLRSKEARMEESKLYLPKIHLLLLQLLNQIHRLRSPLSQSTEHLRP